jgi:hypothetical protein
MAGRPVSSHSLDRGPDPPVDRYDRRAVRRGTIAARWRPARLTGGPMRVIALSARLAVCRLRPDAPIPSWIQSGGAFVATTRTPDELSIVCDVEVVPDDIPREGPWRAFKVQGPLVMTLLGVVAAIADPLRDAGISIFAISTYDTDYVLVHEPDLEAATTALRAAGHEVV